MPSALFYPVSAPRHVRSRHRIGSAALALALAAGLVSLAPAAFADTPTDPAEAQHAAIVPPDEAAAAAAQSQAKLTGQPVVIDGLTTDFEQTVVNPDGTFTTTTNGQPVRTKVGGAWTPVDATLQANADGTVSPKAAIHPVHLSPGGTGPLATLTNAAGKTLSLSVPFTLPTPTLSGDTASYAGVLPDVDLQVTVTVRGGLRHVFVVKSAAAAANPALKNLKLATTGAGLDVTADTHGNLRAQDSASGDPAFTAPAPLMWDSTTAPPPAATPSGRTAAAAQDDPGTPDAVSSAAGPGAGAQSAIMPTSASTGSVTITPVPSVLAGAGTHYPVYLDPSWLPFDRTNLDWTWIQQGYADSPDNWDGNSTTGETHPGVGLQQYQTKTGIERAYYQFNNTAPLLGNVIHSATLDLSEYQSSASSCTDTYPVYLYLSTQISSSTTWNNHQDDTSLGQSRQVGGSGHSGCSANVPFSFDVQSTVQQAANTGWQHITFGLHGNEGNTTAFKRLTSNPVLKIQYDRYPLPPTGLKTDPTPQYASNGSTQPCVDVAEPTNQAFVANPGTQGIHLTATVASEVNQPVRGYFSLWDDTAPGDKITPHGQGYSNGGTYVPSGSAVSYTVPTADFIDGHAYGWNVSATDGLLPSPTVGTCRFRIDEKLPTITFNPVTDPATQFPPSGNGQTTTLHVGDVGQIPFTAADPAPAEGVASGLACMRWSFDPTLAGIAWQCGPALPTGFISVRPTHWGTNIAYLQAKDNAGNTQTASYPFYVPWVPTPLAYGDVTNDGHADVLAPDPTTGALLNYSQALNFDSTPSLQAATAAQAPDGTSWKNFRITHRGTQTAGTPVDDLFVHHDADPTKADSDPTKTGGTKLYYYPNNSLNYGQFNAASIPLARPDCFGDSTLCPGLTAGSTWAPGATWAYTNQITPIGSASTTLTPGLKTTDATGILAVEAGNLWYYPITSAGAYDANGKLSPLGAPTLVAKGGWDNYDLMIPGDALATGKPALWARVRTTTGGHNAGDILQYALTTAAATDSNGTPYTTVTGVAASPATAIGGGVTTAAFPLVGSDGDLNGDNIPDLWASSGNGKIVTWDGVTPDGTAKTAIAYFTGRSNQWLLNGTPNDASGGNNAAPVGTVTWAANHAGTTPGAAAFTGTSALVSQFGAVDTAASYTISTWVKLNTLTGDQYFVAQGGTTRQAFDLGYRPDTKTWTFTTPTGDAMANAAPSADAPPGAATTGTWTHLTGVYDATTHSSTLYVNGHYAGAATNPTPWHSPGRLTIGAIQLTSGATLYNPANATISDTRIYPYAFTTEQAANLYSTS